MGVGGGVTGAAGSSGKAGALPEEDDPLVAGPVPAPGVMAPLVPGSGGGACGAGASGTDCWLWARAATPILRLRPTETASANAAKPDLTGTSSSRNPTFRALHTEASCMALANGKGAPDR